jgi:hypothetical protein
VGPVRLSRAYYHCRHCRAGHCPWDAALRLAAGDLTPAAEELVSLAGLLASFAEAAGKVLPKMAGLRLAESTAERTTEAAGARLARRRAAGEVFGPARDWPWPEDAHGRTCAYVSVDATGVGMQGENGAAAEGRMAGLGLVFAPGPAGGPTRERALAGLYGLPELGEQLRRQAAQVGMDRAEVWVALTDGGAGLGDFMRVYFPRAECVLDFYHAAEHLNGLAKALYPGVEEAAAAAGGWCHTLKHEGGRALLAALEALDLRGKKAEAREAYRREAGYVRNNLHRMDYPRYRANGWLIGSGHVEAACKAVVGQRLKGSGMRWSEAGADAVCHLRALFKSEKGQWDAFCERKVNLALRRWAPGSG